MLSSTIRYSVTSYNRSCLYPKSPGTVKSSEKCVVSHSLLLASPRQVDPTLPDSQALLATDDEAVGGGETAGTPEASELTERRKQTARSAFSSESLVCVEEEDSIQLSVQLGCLQFV